MGGSPAFEAVFERAMILEGVDLKGATAFVSAVHSEKEVSLTVDAFHRAVERTVALVGHPVAEENRGRVSDN